MCIRDSIGGLQLFGVAKGQAPRYACKAFGWESRSWFRHVPRSYIPIKDGAVAEGEFKPRRAEYPLWQDVSEKQAHVGMHLQGRRWGAFSREGSEDGINAFDSHATFASYSAAPGDREDLLRKMPEEHKKILASLEFVVEVEDVDEHGKKLIAVHAGLEDCLLYTSPSPRDATLSRMPSSA